MAASTTTSTPCLSTSPMAVSSLCASTWTPSTSTALGSKTESYSVGLPQAEPAVDHDLLPGHVARGGRRQEQRKPMHVRRKADPVHRDRLSELDLQVRVQQMPAADIRREHARRDCVDSDAVGG